MLQPLLIPREIYRGIAEILRPPRRIRPSDAAAAYVRNEKGPWLSEFTPYVVEPLDQLGGRQYQGIVFVGRIVQFRESGVSLLLDDETRPRKAAVDARVFPIELWKRISGGTISRNRRVRVELEQDRIVLVVPENTERD